MYCFATLDYFSSCWAGWNRSGPGKDQTARLIDFMTKFLLYGRKEATLAVHFWRHKLMHTSEPRVLRNKDNDEFYIWRTGTELDRHMELARLTDQQYRLDFDPLVFLEVCARRSLGRAATSRSFDTPPTSRKSTKPASRKWTAIRSRSRRLASTNRPGSQPNKPLHPTSVRPAGERRIDAHVKMTDAELERLLRHVALLPLRLAVRCPPCRSDRRACGR
jgi:hypothetical protein